MEKSRSLLRKSQSGITWKKLLSSVPRKLDDAETEWWYQKMSFNRDQVWWKRNWQYLENSRNGSHFTFFHFSRFDDHVFRMEIEGRDWYQMKGYPWLPISCNWNFLSNFSGFKVMAIDRRPLTWKTDTRIKSRRFDAETEWWYQKMSFNGDQVW